MKTNSLVLSKALQLKAAQHVTSKDCKSYSDVLQMTTAISYQTTMDFFHFKESLNS